MALSPEPWWYADIEDEKQPGFWVVGCKTPKTIVAEVFRKDDASAIVELPKLIALHKNFLDIYDCATVEEIEEYATRVKSLLARIANTAEKKGGS